MDWGVESLSKEERFAKSIGAGVDQIGGTEESGYIVSAVKDGKLTEARVNEAAGRVLLQKFQMGLFEQPYVDAAKASDIAGRADFVKEGEAAQAKAVVVLENKPGKDGKALLPVAAGKKNLKPIATALLGDFGAGDGPLMEVITGKTKAAGKLPFELPSSEEAVLKQKGDLPHDSVAPLYGFGYGLKY
jgi:beta-glucosidase-like glycosyl hydrolase